MSSSTPTADVAAVEHLDGAWSIDCECSIDFDTGEQCGHQAAWWLICRHCRTPVAQCNPHAALWARLVPTLGAACSECGSAACGAHVTSLFEAIPIGARP